MQYLIEILLILLSFSFLTLHIQFMRLVLTNDIVSSLLLLLACSLFSWVRKLWKLSFNYYFGNLITLFVLSALLYESVSSSNQSLSPPCTIISSLSTVCLTFASFESMPLLLALKRHYPSAPSFNYLFTVESLIHIGLAMLVVSTFTNPYKLLITSQSIIIRIAAISLAANLFLATPLTAHPIIFNLERHFWTKREKSLTRQMLKNLSRFILILSAFTLGFFLDARSMLTLIGGSVSLLLGLILPIVMVRRIRNIRSNIGI